MARQTALNLQDSNAPLFITGNMEDVSVRHFSFGQVAIYTHGAPDKGGANEDAGLVLPLDDERGVLAVADGVGGMQAGARASRLALESICTTVEAASEEDWSVREAVFDGFDEANRAVSALGGAATTLAAVRIQDRTVRSFHVGDSSVLLVGNHGKIKLHTVDHSPTGYAVEAGVLEREEAIHHDERHIILNAVGSPDMRVEVGSPLKLASYDTLLVASDGLYDNLHLPEIVEIIRKGPLVRAARELVSACRDRMQNPEADAPSKSDDLTVVIYRPQPGR